MATTERVRPVVEPILDDLGLRIYDIELAGGVLRILADREGGVGIDDLSTATRLISRALDDTEVIAGSYTLEVSSPGLERPLRTPAHFAGAAGTEVSIKTVPDFEGDRRIAGVLTAADETAITVRSSDGEEHRIPLQAIQKARTVFEWGPARPERPSKRAPHAATQKAPAR
jgi:ribosome maturation factor RimP